MAELATIARPYAEALFRVVEADHDGAGLAAWGGMLHELAGLAQHPEVQSLASNPKLAHDQISDLLLSAVKSPVDEHAKNFVHMLVDNRRLELLPEIALQFDALKNAREGAADVEIASAFPLEGKALDELVASLERKFKRKLNPAVVLDKSLIGGVRVTVGDEVLDTSVRAQLAAMQTALAA